MKQAANGSEEAYKKLQQAAQQDILAHCDIDRTAFDKANADLQAELQEANFPDLEIGASLDDEEALQAMTDLVNSANMTADQATAYLASMGIDAEVEEDTTVSNAKHEYIGATANVTEQPVTYYDPISATTVTSSVPSITYTTQPAEDTETNENTAFALKVTSAKKSSGGSFKHKNSSNASRGGGGGRRRGGGGGGRGREARHANKKTTDDKKSAEKEIDRYHVIKSQIDDTTKQLDKLAEAKIEHLVEPSLN